MYAQTLHIDPIPTKESHPMSHCKVCEPCREDYRCPACKLTGHEIAAKRKEERKKG